MGLGERGEGAQSSRAAPCSHGFPGPASWECGPGPGPQEGQSARRKPEQLEQEAPGHRDPGVVPTSGLNTEPLARGPELSCLSLWASARAPPQLS